MRLTLHVLSRLYSTDAGDPFNVPILLPAFIFLQSLMQSLMQYNTTTSPAALDIVLSAHGPASFAVAVGMRHYLDFATVTDPSPVILLILYLYIWLFLVSRGVA